MKTRNRKGSILILTLLIFVVLMTFGTIILNLMSSENKMSLHHQRETQAYYIARAGAEAVEVAIMNMDEEEIENLNNKLDMGSIIIEEMLIGEGIAKVELIKNADKLNIESKGQVENVQDKVTKVIIIDKETSNIKVEHAIFSLGNLTLSNGTVEGDVGTNNSINVPGGNPSLKGNAYILKGKDFSAKEWWMNSWIKNYTTKDLGQEKGYEPFKFPQFPVNNSITNFFQSGINQTTISTSKDYNTFEVRDNTTVYIDTAQGDINLNIKEFNLINGNIIVQGSNKLTLYVGKMVVGSGSTINYYNRIPMDSKQVDIYHNGSSKLTIAGNVKIAGSLYIEKAEIDLGGSASILGNVYSNGSTITLSGNSDITKGLIYAPNADIRFTGSGKAYGAVIGNTISLSGGGSVIFDINYVDTSSIISSSQSTISFKPSYFK